MYGAILHQYLLQRYYFYSELQTFTCVFLANIAHISKNTCNFAARKVMNS